MTCANIIRVLAALHDNNVQISNSYDVHYLECKECGCEVYDQEETHMLELIASLREHGLEVLATDGR